MNFKVKVVEKSGYGNDFTVGKVYKAKDGYLLDNDNYEWGVGEFKNIKDINDYFKAERNSDAFVKFERVLEVPPQIEIVDNDYHVGELVRCTNVTNENCEGLVVGDLYTVLGSTLVTNNYQVDKVYSVRSKDGNLVHTMDRFERVFEHEVDVEKPSVNEFDIVEKPSHYNQFSFEVIDIIKEATAELKGLDAVCIANVLKYVLRYQFKNGVEDLKKAKKYLTMVIDNIESKQTKSITQRQICYIASLTTELHLDRYKLPSYLSPIKNYKELTEVEASVLISKLVAMKDYMNDMSKYVE